MTATISTSFIEQLFGFKVTGSASEEIGREVELLGDVDGDGFADLGIGSFSGNLNFNAAVLFGGSDLLGDEISTASLNGADGFRVDIQGAQQIGAGDMNGDGLADVIFGFDSASDGHILFGTSDPIVGAFPDGTLDGADGVEIIRNGDRSSSIDRVELNGDFNGDGFNDAVVADARGGLRQVSVVFGGDTFNSTFDTDALDGSEGFRVNATADNLLFGEFVGDFNGDGFDDLIIHENNFDNGDTTRGASVIVFGGQDIGATNTIAGLDDVGVGVRIKSGSTSVEHLAVGVGDVNGDGFDDTFINDRDSSLNGGAIIFGGNLAGGEVIDIGALDGSDGFHIAGYSSELLGESISAAGDFNGDGIDDFIIGAFTAEAGGVTTGGAYVVFGRSGFGALLNVTDMSLDEGFRILGERAGIDGYSVSGGEDINGDGLDDVVIGGNASEDSGGSAFVMFGQPFGVDADIGGDGADTFTGDGHTQDRFFGGAGDDILDGAGDADVLSGGAGDDILIIGSGNFIRVDGGSGNDILRIPGGAGITLDFTEIGHEGIHSIETIDLCGVSGNFLKIRPVDVAGLSETTNKLFVTGGAADGVTLVGDSLFGDAGDAQTFAFDGVETVGGVTFDRFVSGAREISIQQGIVISREVSIADLADESIRFLEVDGDFDGDPAAFGIGTAGTLGADLNGDGLSDVLIGGPGPVADNGVIFDIRAEELLGSGDFDLQGQDNLSFGSGLGSAFASVGDINGDGFDDYVQGQPALNSNAGYASIEFGNAGTGGTTSFDPVSAQTGTTGQFGFDVSGGGDFNGDGIADFIGGAPRFDGAPGAESGRAYVIFGQDVAASLFDINLDALNGTDGILLDGVTAGTRFGQGVESLGDINGDGLNDFAIAAPFLDNGGNNLGSVFVVFGQVGGFGPTFDVTSLNGQNGFRIDGDTNILQHRLVNIRDAGDVNNDGFDDILVSGFATQTRHIVFGSDQDFSSSLGLANLDGADGFEVTGFSGLVGADDSASAGDFNGDGISDIAFDDSLSNGQAGRAIIMFGRDDGFAASESVDGLSDDRGFIINGDTAGEEFGVIGRQPGDVNGDGFSDILIGAPGATGGNGESHLVFGAGQVDVLGTAAAETLNGSGLVDVIFGLGDNDTLRGGNGDDTLKGGDGNDILVGQGDDDILIGGAGIDRLNGGTGADVMRGGDGNDIYTVDNINDVVVERFSEGLDRINTTVDFTNPGNVEFLVVASTSQGLNLTGSVFRDQISGANKISIGDVIDGRGGNDLIVGKVGDDVLNGGDGNDRLFGNSGADTFNGGLGNDVMTGQQGIDTYEFDMAPGRDSITDFTTGEDILDVSGFFGDFGDVQAATVDVNGNAQITFGPGGNFLTLIGVTEAQLSSSDFDFGPLVT